VLKKFINNLPETRLRRVSPLLETEGSFVEKIEIKYSFILQTDFNSFPLKGKVAMPQAWSEGFIPKII
jgi:hypothetical protein